MSSASGSGRPAYSEGRDALLDATVRVVARSGLRGLTYRAVAAEAGTTHALVSYHFGSRRNLILEAARYASRSAVAGARLDRVAGDLEQLEASLPSAAAEGADFHVFLFELALEARRDPELRPEVLREYDEFRAATEAALADLGVAAGSPALARLVFAAIDGLTLQQLLDGDAEATRDAVVALRQLLGGASEA